MTGFTAAGRRTVESGTQAKYPPIGQMVGCGGYKLHIYCAGEGSQRSFWMR